MGSPWMAAAALIPAIRPMAADSRYPSTPVSWPAIAVVIIWQFMTSWNEFILALVTMNTNQVKPLTLVPLVYSGQFMMRPGPMFAILTLITLPVIVVYYLMQRFMVSGLTAGAVRG